MVECLLWEQDAAGSSPVASTITSRFYANYTVRFFGPVAQLGERSVRIREVESSSLFRSTIELYFLSADQKLWGFISMKNSAKALKIPKRGRSSAGSAKHPVCHPGKVEGITKFVQDAESVISMQKQYKKENQSSV